MTASIGSGRPVLTAWRRIPGPPRDRIKARLLRLYRALLAHHGPQGWWPARTPFEVAVGAILTQHTAWAGAAHALAALRRESRLTPHRLARLDASALEPLVRPAGTYRLKARRLLDFTRWLLERWGGDFQAMRRADLAPLRRETLAVPGLGPETADAILLYAAGRPVFVADAYTRRLLVRHGLLRASAGYEEARVFLEAHLPSDPALFNEFHALIVAAAKSHCRTLARCESCPLASDLPPGRRSTPMRAVGSAPRRVRPRRPGA